ncbi:MAG TPA: A/G-specific adenine glycosylase [Candidatus Barnesiella excrementigallinarum]|nr:A/G-specific adenine glycosylase [Candidatus Barnesiella excrementigallinarum]
MKKEAEEQHEQLAPLSADLHKWYAGNHRVLPWRGITDAYRIWISEIILQQTRVAQGYEYYNRFVSRFPDVRSLAAADDDEVMKLWQGLGYYSRARNLLTAARQVVDRFGGEFPTTYEGIRSLQGIGDYTAAAIASFAYGLPHAVVDGNVYRVLSRIYGIDVPIDTTEGKKLFAALADELLDLRDPGGYNQALMEFGALYCVPRSPRCGGCMFADRCMALATNRVEELPVKQGRTVVKPRYFNYFYVWHGADTWVRRREGRDIWRNLYELPLIETAEEQPLDVLQRSEAWAGMFRDAGRVSVSARVYACKHVLSHRIIHARFYVVETERIPQLAGYMRIPVERLGDYAVSRLTEGFLEKLSENYPSLF